MKKRRIRIFCVTIFAITLMILAGKGGMSHGDVQEENDGLEVQGIAEAAETEVRMVRGGSSPKSEAGEKQYSLEEVEEGYELTLYDKEGRKVYSEWCPLNRSWINELTPDVLEIGVSVGSPAHYIEFFDKETAELSPTYFNPIMVGDKYIAFMEEDGVLVLCDLFQRGELYMEIRRDFTGFANRIGAIININLIDDKHVEIEYYEGEYESEEYTKTKEMITLE